MRSAADLDDVRVAGDEPNHVERHGEQVGDDLRERRLVPLARGVRAGDDLDLAAPA